MKQVGSHTHIPYFLKTTATGIISVGGRGVILTSYASEEIALQNRIYIYGNRERSIWSRR